MINKNDSEELLSRKVIIIQRNVRRYLIQKIIQSSKEEYIKIFHLIEGIDKSDPIQIKWLSNKRLCFPKQDNRELENESIKIKKTLTIEKIKILEMKLQLLNQKIEDRKKELLKKEIF
jgi:hypothetical protein